jgi:UDP-N-acetylglucosamine 2-epimerase (non-hydrolysing)
VTAEVLQRPVLVVAGARPNFMKVVPILHELERRGVPRLFVHTGQHYDVKMSQALLSDLRAPAPDVMLDVGSGTHAAQTARIMERFEPVLMQHRPSWVVVVGDVNSTLACALVTAKLREELGCRIAHVEAGLRSHDWAMPEEVNRVLTDQLSDLLLLPVEEARENIEREGLSTIPTAFVGNVMIDALFSVLEGGRAMNAPAKHGVHAGHYVLATLHRPSNVDDPAQLALLIEALAAVAVNTPVVFPMHPRTRARAETPELRAHLERLIVTEPFGYMEMAAMLSDASATITDSGGVQQEATVLGVPCVTMRDRTEWLDTVERGTNRLASWPPTAQTVVRDTQGAIARGRAPVGSKAPPGWDGKSAERIVDAILGTTGGRQGAR